MKFKTGKPSKPPESSGFRGIIETAPEVLATPAEA